MSIKSLLQLILLALIVLIIGGIYFLYFYSNSNDEIKLEIFDVNGRSIIKKNIINESTISELKLSSGFYFLHFEIDDELLVKKLIKQ